MLLDRHWLAVEKVAPRRVLPIPHVHLGDVGKLVVDDGEEAFAGRKGLHRRRQRRNVDQYRVVGRRPRAGVRIVAEVLQKDGRRLPRGPAEFLLMEAKRILIGAGDVRRQIGLHRIEVEKVEVLRFERRQVDSRRVGWDVRRAFLLRSAVRREAAPVWARRSVVVSGCGGGGGGACCATAAEAVPSIKDATMPDAAFRGRFVPRISPQRRAMAAETSVRLVYRVRHIAGL